MEYINDYSTRLEASNVKKELEKGTNRKFKVVSIGGYSFTLYELSEFEIINEEDRKSFGKHKEIKGSRFRM